jgi:nucleoside phosphorylase
MLYITVALSAEARPLIEHFQLTRTYTLPYTVFENKEVKLIATGIGIENTMMATSALLGRFPPSKTDILLNIGICATPQSFEIGEAFLVHKISYKNNFLFPDILFEHTLKESDIFCVDEPANEILKFPVDMESYGVYKAASRFFSTHQMLFLKVASDHFEPQSVTKELAIELISKNLKNLDTVLHSAAYIANKTPLFTQDEKKLIDLISDYLTKAQSDAFYDACCYYKLHHKKPLHVESPDSKKLSKKERSEYLESLIKTLTR